MFINLSEEQQQFIAGGVDTEYAQSNFAQRLAKLAGYSTSGPEGSTAKSYGELTTTNTAAADFLSLGGATDIIPTALANVPVPIG